MSTVKAISMHAATMAIVCAEFVRYHLKIVTTASSNHLWRLLKQMRYHPSNVIVDHLTKPYIGHLELKFYVLFSGVVT